MLFSILFILNLGISTVHAGAVSLPFTSCAPSTVTEPNALKRVNVTSVYGQIYLDDANPPSRSLKLTTIAQIGDTLDGYSNQTGYLGESISLGHLRGSAPHVMSPYQRCSCDFQFLHFF